MTICALLAAAYTFTASATGLEKGAPVEFLFVGKDSDRAYEALFELDGSVADFCAGLEKAGLPKGHATDPMTCRLWPVGCPVTLKPALSDFVDTTMPPELPLGRIIYTGGTRTEKGSVAADSEQPFSVFALYSLAQSPLVFNGIYEQGVVYNCHHVKSELKKGERRTFTLSWDAKENPPSYRYEINATNAVAVLTDLKAKSAHGEIDVQIDFSDQLTVAQATAAAQAVAQIDSLKIKVNGRRDGGLFYRAFLPLVKWLDRQERLVQPFELTVGPTNRLVFIEEDWSVEGDDPKLTPKEIPFAEAVKHDRTDTCFIFASKHERLSTLRKAMALLKGVKIRNWYVFPQD